MKETEKKNTKTEGELQPDNNEVNVEEILKKYDKESAFRTPAGIWDKITVFLCIAFSGFQLYTAALGVYPAQIQRSVHLAFTLCLVFLLYPFSSSKVKDNKIPWFDFVLAGLGVWVGMYIVINYMDIMLRAGLPTWGDLVYGGLAILLVLEACRRAVGLPISIVATVFLLYAKFGNLIPGMLGHGGFPVKRIITHMYVTTEGILGLPLGVSATFVFLFILFGAFLHKTGLGKFFIDLALAATGHRVGGPAKVAVLASGLFGSISGSSVANTVTTGAFTIPLMKSIGYPAHFAAAVEAAASTGGQLMPPIMGAAAFIMAQFLGIAYIKIAIAAVLPALMYYLAVGIMVHMEARRLGLKGLPRENLPQVGKVLKSGGHMLLPILVIVYLLVKGYTPLRAAFVSILVTVGISMLKSSTRMSFRDILEAMENGARAALGVATACACAGIIIGVVTLTGVGLKLANGIVVLSGGIFFFTLMFTMIASIILGMGLPTTAKYIVLASMAAPAIQKFGVPPLAAHMFILYYGIIADLTPPVALAAYAGAGIANANAMRTGFSALRLAIAGFTIPFIFAYNPQLLLINTTPLNVIFYFTTAIIGTTSLAFAGSGYWLRNLRIWERLILFVGAIALIFPGIYTDLTGFGALVVIFLIQKYTSGKTKKS